MWSQCHGYTVPRYVTSMSTGFAPCPICSGFLRISGRSGPGVLAWSSRLLLAVRDDRSGSDYQVVYLAALRVEQAGLVRSDDEMHPIPGAQLGQQPGYVCLGGAGGDV